jgi:sterol desaturase/sphingolipid hydroxylase (fatty acid hydroxylase superfamily)
MMPGWGMPGWAQWVLLEVPLVTLTAVGTHLVISFCQTAFHRWLGHRRMGGFLFRNHINFHHGYYAKGNLASATSEQGDGHITHFFLVPMFLVGGGLFFALPFQLFLVMTLTAAASFYAHVFFDNEYHNAASRLTRFAWFRHKQQLHFVHHLHANSNFAVIDFFWDRVLGTYRKPDGVIR